MACHSDTILLAVRAIAPNLAELRMNPVMRNTARFGLVTLRQRSQAPALTILRELMAQRMAGQAPADGAA